MEIVKIGEKTLWQNAVIRHIYLSFFIAKVFYSMVDQLRRY